VARREQAGHDASIHSLPIIVGARRRNSERAHGPRRSCDARGPRPEKYGTQSFSLERKRGRRCLGSRC
jgi:hypothetical protein